MIHFDKIIFSKTEPANKFDLWLQPLFDTKEQELYGNYALKIYNREAWENILEGTLDSMYKQIDNILEQSFQFTKDQIDELKKDYLVPIITNITESIILLQEEDTKIKNDIIILKDNDRTFTIDIQELRDKLSGLSNTFILQGVIDLPSGEPELPVPSTPGYAYIIKREGYSEEYVYTENNEWVNIGTVNDLTNYYQKDEVDTKFVQVSSQIQNSKVSEKEAAINGLPYSIALLRTRSIEENDKLEEIFRYNNSVYGAPLQVLLNRGSLAFELGNTRTEGILKITNPQASSTIKNNSTTTGSKEYLLPSNSGTLALDTEATESTKGLMSPEDKKKLDSIPESTSTNIPIGGIIMWSGSKESIPEGWLLCDGSREGSIVTPDLRGRFIMAGGYDDSYRSVYEDPDKGAREKMSYVNAQVSNTHINTKDYLNDEPKTVLGSYSVKLTANESGLPSHVHSTSSAYHKTGGTGKYSTQEYRDVAFSPISANSKSLSSYPITTNGSSIQEYSLGKEAESRHNNVPPMYVLAFIMRVK